MATSSELATTELPQMTSGEMAGAKREMYDKMNTVELGGVALGGVLKDIRDRRGYLTDGHDSFKDWIDADPRLIGIGGRSQVYRLIDFYDVFTNLKLEHRGKLALPMSHALELKALPPEEQPRVYELVIQKNPEATTKDIARAVQKALPPAAKTKPKKVPAFGWTDAEIAKDTDLAAALKKLAGVYPKADVAAIRDGTFELKRADVLTLSTLPTATQESLAVLIFDKRWSLADSIAFLNRMPEITDEQKNYCLASKGGYLEVKDGAFSMTLKYNGPRR